MTPEEIAVTFHAEERRRLAPTGIIKEILGGEEIPRNLARVLLGRFGPNRRYRDSNDKYIAPESKDGLYVLNNDSGFWSVITFISMDDSRKRFLGDDWEEPVVVVKEEVKPKKEKKKKPRKLFNLSAPIRKSILDCVKIEEWLLDVYLNSDTLQTPNEYGKFSWTLPYPYIPGLEFLISGNPEGDSYSVVFPYPPGEFGRMLSRPGLPEEVIRQIPGVHEMMAEYVKEEPGQEWYHLSFDNFAIEFELVPDDSVRIIDWYLADKQVRIRE